jgi:DNA-binding XRE family transcriptional regulator
MIYLSTNLRVLRNGLEVTQEKIANRLDLKTKTYAAYEEGRTQPPNNTLIKIAQLFGITINDLVLVDLSSNKKKSPPESILLTKYNVAEPNIKTAINALLQIK